MLRLTLMCLMKFNNLKSNKSVEIQIDKKENQKLTQKNQKSIFFGFI